MSDEREGAVPDGDGTDESGSGTGSRTAVATQPLRPTGKRARRQLARPDGDDTGTASDTATAAGKNGSGSKPKKAKKAKKPSDGGRNPVLFVWTFLKQVVAELRKVIWPNRKQMVSYTTVVLVFLAFMVTLIGLVDLGLTKLVVLVFG